GAGRDGNVWVAGVKQRRIDVLLREHRGAAPGKDPEYSLAPGPSRRDALVKCFADEKNNLLGVSIDVLGPKLSLNSPEQIRALFNAVDMLRSKIAEPVAEEKLEEAKENMAPEKSNVKPFPSSDQQHLTAAG